MDCPHQPDDNVCYRCQERQNYFDVMEEHVVHDVFLMILSDENDYESVEDVLIGETTFSEQTTEHWKGVHGRE